MDTSINRSQEQDFSVLELMESPHPEERELAEKATAVIIELINKLKPLLPYLTSPYMLTNNSAVVCPEDCIKQRAIANEVRAILLGPLSKLHGPAVKKSYLFVDDKGYLFSAIKCEPVGGKRYHLVHDCRALPQNECCFRELVESLRNVLDEAVAKREAHLASIKERSEKLNQILTILRR